MTGDKGKSPTMPCYSESTIEEMATEHAETSAGKQGRSPVETDTHMGACFRCRDLFAFYLEVYENRMASGSPRTRVLALRELVIEDPEFHPEAVEVEPLLQLAADTEEEDAGTELTFATADHYLVRIYPNQGREGSTAYLVLDLPNQDIATLLREYRASIDIEGTEFEFSATGETALPTYPVRPRHLVLHQISEPR